MQRRAVLTVAATALVVRLGYILVFTRHYRPDSDADNYYSLARALARGKGYVFPLPFEFQHATAIRPPLYPAVAAVAMRVFGSHVGVAQAVNVVAGTVVCVLGALLAYRIAGERAALCAGLVLALYPPLIANDVTLLVESLAVALCFACILLILDGRTVLAGLALGLMMLDRASAQFLVLVFGAWVLSRYGWRDALRFAVVALVVVAPWVARNWVRVGGPVVVATNGYNLNAEYSPEARHEHAFVDAYFEPRFAPLRIAAIDEIDFDATLRRRALKELRAHPTLVARVVARNAAAWFEVSPGRNNGAERLDGRNRSVRDYTLPLFFVVTAAGLFGLVRARRSPAAQLLLLTAGYFTVVCVFSIVAPRLRSVFDACMAVGAGTALAWVLDRRITVRDDAPVRRAMRGIASVAVLSVALVAVVVAAVLWRHSNERHARSSVAAAVAPGQGAIDATASQLAAGAHSGMPPRVDRDNLDGLKKFVAVLGRRAPEVDQRTRRPVAAALRAVRVPAHEIEVVALLSAGEYFEAAKEHRPPSVDRVAHRYELEARGSDPTLGPFRDVVNGAALRQAISPVDALGAFLSGHS